MTAKLDLTPEQVISVVAALKKTRPVYAEILEFYGRLFVVQEESKRRLQIETIKIGEDIRSVRAREKFPLIEVKDFAYDRNEAAGLLMSICRLAKEANPKLAVSGSVLLKAVETGLDTGRLFSGLLGSDEALFENISAELEIDKKILGFITYNSLKPSLCACADQLSAYLNKNEPWQAGYCPICGSAPILSILKGEGERSLICNFCWHQWAVKRVCCPFCTNSDNKYLHYFFSEEDKSLRVDLCDNCKKYIKTIDTRGAERLIYPPLEQTTTLHLDIKAQEEGFEAGVKLFMEA